MNAKQQGRLTLAASDEHPRVHITPLCTTIERGAATEQFQPSDIVVEIDDQMRTVEVPLADLVNAWRELERQVWVANAPDVSPEEALQRLQEHTA